jgi:two-component system, NarL family, sensor kinase
MLSDSQYFSILYETASSLNKESSLHAALQKTLAKAVELLELETGWIWLLQSDRSVYLAASYNLPPALKDHPERLSGWCYCIERYFTDNIEQALNISEIMCTRLKNIKAGTYDLKFHATIPINIGDQKVGLINLLSKESQELNQRQLAVLNTIGELMGIAIQRTAGQENSLSSAYGNHTPVHDVLRRVFAPRLMSVASSLEKLADSEIVKTLSQARAIADEAVSETKQLANHLNHILDEGNASASGFIKTREIHFPASALTKRELEILGLVRKGMPNKQVGETLFISERTVKFHITSILSKLFARTRTEAVDIALRRGLI